jgi:hypothetical protein
MTAFDPIVIGWAGREYTIPSRNVMRAIARIEDVVTLVELQQYAQRGTMPMAKIADAYASVLRFAGAQVTGEDVYAGMFGGEGDTETQANVLAAITGLQEMMMPPEIRKKLAASGNGTAAPDANQNAPAAAKTNAAGTSKKPTKRRSATRQRGS